MNIIGISAYYHDSAAALISNGEILFAAEEERFSRIKHDKSFPIEALQFCLTEANLELIQIEKIIFYDRPFEKFERLLETILWNTPYGHQQFNEIFKEWISGGKFSLESTIKKELSKKFNLPENKIPSIHFCDHHLSHAASAFFPSPYETSVILCVDGVGEWATTSAWIGNKNIIEKLWQIDFPHSLGLLYSAFTYYLGFKVNDGEYKVMGLAPYGEPKYVDLIYKNLIDVKADGSFRLNMKYFNYTRGVTMTNDLFHNLFNGPPRSSEDKITDKEKNIARSIQVVLEEVMLKIAKNLQLETGIQNLCMAGGVALNCVANAKIKEAKIFDDIWIQPAAGDAGGAVGSALNYWHQTLNKTRNNIPLDSMKGCYLGPQFSNEEIKLILDKEKINYQIFENEENLYKTIAHELDQQKVIGLFSGRMEFGPRSLGSRSIIADPRAKNMQSILNLKIKYRESFRPFAPAVLIEDFKKYFHSETPSPYMLFTAKVNLEVSTLSSITHVDQTARIQTVDMVTNKRFHKLISEFKNLTSCPVIINTSFNIRGEPIVCNPLDAIKCFFNTEMDLLVLENIIIRKNNQINIERFKYTTSELSNAENTILKHLPKTKKELRQFAIIFCTFIDVFGLIFHAPFRTFPQVIMLVAANLFILTLSSIKPNSLIKAEIIWSSTFKKIGIIKTNILLFFIYFFILTPYGILLRRLIKGQVSLKRNKSISSYKILAKNVSINTLFP